mmetsp:Transcript_80351/g.215415  ORF Transcript_80351/g.215415 Transcript_80351/m.215415 type:complete len:131 (-) Transcript_80351:150-542(-)
MSLSVAYMDNDDLSVRLQELFEVFDESGSKVINCEEFCSAVRKLSFSPPIYFNSDDFDELTRNGTLCDRSGLLSSHDFEVVMRDRLFRYTLNRLARSTIQTPQQAAMTQANMSVNRNRTSCSHPLRTLHS